MLCDTQQLCVIRCIVYEKCVCFIVIKYELLEHFFFKYRECLLPLEIEK